MTTKRVLLIVLDGWGISMSTAGNAIASAKAPFYQELSTAYPHGTLDASGEAVGLPDGQMGNS
jgi:2,3-bisphosphoglycerate-independent phosphoglycerate mutase